MTKKLFNFQSYKWSGYRWAKIFSAAFIILTMLSREPFTVTRNKSPSTLIYRSFKIESHYLETGRIARPW